MAMINVPAGQSLQTALSNAQPGDVLSLEAGATWTGPIELPAKAGTAEIVIQSSRAGELPQGRVSSSHSALMPKIVAPNAEQAIRTRLGAHHYRLDGIEAFPEANVAAMYDLVRFGSGRGEQNTLSAVAHHLKMDRCYVHGQPASSFQRGLSLNSSDTEVTRCYFSEIHGIGMDSQAIASWNTPGRNKIIDNYLEAAAENIMLGGSDPASAEFIPSDYQILRNHVFKPLIWKGKGWVIKNLFEIKNGQRILIDGNRFENNWGGEGQSGIAILFTVRNQEGSAPYSIIDGVTFTNNIVLNAEGSLNFLGSDNEKPSQQAINAVIRNNVFDKINGTFVTINGYYNVTVERNTHLQSGNTLLFYGGRPSQGFVYRDNVTIEKPYGLRDETGIEGQAALDKWAPSAVFAPNVIATPYTAKIAGNEYPTSLTVSTDYRTSYTGKGADIDLLLAAQKGTVTPPVTEPTPTPTPAPTPTPQPAPAPTPAPTPPTPSPDGTKAITITDAQSDVWTLGSLRETLRNGTHMAGGFGSIYKWLGGVVYVLGTNGWWYKWTGTAWASVSQQEPGTVPPTRVIPWPKQQGQQNSLLETQRVERFFLRRTDGNSATFEKVL